MRKMLDAVVFDGYTVQDIAIAAGALIVFLIIIGILAKIFKKKENLRHFQSAECSGCGWRGKVSRYAGRCPKCNEPLGQQQAKRRTA